MLEAARGVGGFVLEVQVDAAVLKGGQAQGNQMGVGATLVIGLDAGDGFVEPGGMSWRGLLRMDILRRRQCGELHVRETRSI